MDVLLYLFNRVRSSLLFVFNFSKFDDPQSTLLVNLWTYACVKVL